MREFVGQSTARLPHSRSELFPRSSRSPVLPQKVDKLKRRISYGNESDGAPQDRVAGSMGCRAQRAVEQGEGVLSPARRAEQAAPRTPVGEGREGLRLRRSERQGDACRSFRREKPVDCVSLHVRTWLGGRLPKLLVPFGP